MMAIVYQEFDTTPAALVTDLIAKITTHPNWTPGGTTSPSTTLTAQAASTTTGLTVASTSGFYVGERITVTVSGTTYVRTVSSINSSTALTINQSYGVIVPSGTVVSGDERLVRCTTTRGADIVVDLNAAGDATFDLQRLSTRFWRTLGSSFAGASSSEATDRFCYFRNNSTGATTTMALHVVLSVSRDHLFISIEGPRGGETGATNASYGSVRNYLLACEVTPYHAADTVPCVLVAASVNTLGAAASIANGAASAAVSRNSTNTSSWVPARLATMAFPAIKTNSQWTVQNFNCSIDGNSYLFPYVVFQDAEGLRGRLSRVFFAGLNVVSVNGDTPAFVGSKVTYDGIVYKLLAVNKSDSSAESWGALGAVSNGNTAEVGSSIVAAVPISEVTP